MKRSGANWYKEISNYLSSNCRLKEVSGWSCVFINDKITVSLFVDDMIVTFRRIADAEEFISQSQRTVDKKALDSEELIGVKTEDNILN